jgi:putative ABC transport system ATP-binding protein
MPKKSTSLMRAEKLSKSYFSGDPSTPEDDLLETKVLHEIDLEISQGEFVSIMGPSGSGKSTLMHILGFLDTPTKGSYHYKEKRMRDMSDNDLALIRATEVSFVFQAFNLLPRTTVLENVLLPLLYHPTVREEDRYEKAMKAIASVGLTDRATYLTNQLSGGQMQRVAIARALVTNPEVIFADEPTGNLDSASGSQVMGILQKLHGEGRTIILVTHERNTAEHAERIIHILDGRIDSDLRKFKRVIAKQDVSLK